MYAFYAGCAACASMANWKFKNRATVDDVKTTPQVHAPHQILAFAARQKDSSSPSQKSSSPMPQTRIQPSPSRSTLQCASQQREICQTAPSSRSETNTSRSLFASMKVVCSSSYAQALSQSCKLSRVSIVCPHESTSVVYVFVLAFYRYYHYFFVFLDVLDILSPNITFAMPLPFVYDIIKSICSRCLLIIETITFRMRLLRRNGLLCSAGQCQTIWMGHFSFSILFETSHHLCEVL